MSTWSRSSFVNLAPLGSVDRADGTVAASSENITVSYVLSVSLSERGPPIPDVGAVVVCTDTLGVDFLSVAKTGRGGCKLEVEPVAWIGWSYGASSGAGVSGSISYGDQC